MKESEYLLSDKALEYLKLAGVDVGTAEEKRQQRQAQQAQHKKNAEEAARKKAQATAPKTENGQAKAATPPKTPISSASTGTVK